MVNGYLGVGQQGRHLCGTTRSKWLGIIDEDARMAGGLALKIQTAFGFVNQNADRVAIPPASTPAY